MRTVKAHLEFGTLNKKVPLVVVGSDMLRVTKLEY